MKSSSSLLRRLRRHRLPTGLMTAATAALTIAPAVMAQTDYSKAVTADNPLFYWNFDQAEVGAGILHSRAGAAVTTENDLQPVGSATRVTHASLSSGLRLGSAAGLDGFGSFFQTPGRLRTGKIELTGAWAVEFWMKSDGVDAKAYLVNFGISPGGDNAPAVIYNFKPSVVEVFTGSGGRTDEGGPVFADQEWHHVVAVYFGNGTDGVAPRTDIYLDGVATTGLQPISRRLNLDRLVFGAALPNGADTFTGNLDELAVYDLQALGLEDEVAVDNWASALVTRHRTSATAAAGESYTNVVKADKPLLYWNFDEAEPGAAAVQQMPVPDAVPGENRLTPVNTPLLATHEALASGLKLGSAADLSAGSFFHTRPLVTATDETSLPGPYAIELWFQSQASNEGTYQLNFGNYTANGDNSPALIYNFGTAPLHVELFNGPQRTGLGGPTVTDQAWHHLVIAYYGGGGTGVADRLDFYLDRQNYPRAGVVNQPLNLAGMVVGAAVLNGANAFTGRIDELAIYDLSSLADEAAVTAKVSSMVNAHFAASGAAMPETVITIGAQPQSKTSSIGQSVVFTVAASVTGTNEALNYQWFRDGVALIGENTGTYTSPALQLRDVGDHSYTVRVSAGAAFKDSAAAVLTVTAPPVLARTAYASQVIADAPLLYWNFDEASGPALQLMPLGFEPAPGANDLKPTSTAGRLDLSVEAGSPSIGYAADFPGNGHFKTLLESGLSELSGPFGVEFWVRSLAANPQTYLVNFGNYEVAGGDNSPALIYNFNPNYLELFGPGRTATEGAALPDSEWHHVMYVFYGSDAVGVAPLVEIYLDGEAYSIANSATNWRISLAGLVVGAALPNGVNSFRGNLDELAIYDFSAAADETGLRTRVQSLIASHMQASTGVISTPASLNIQVSGTNATLTWTAGAGIILQESPDLAAWITVNGATSPFTVPLPAGGGRKFYRLAKP